MAQTNPTTPQKNSPPSNGGSDAVRTQFGNLSSVMLERGRFAGQHGMTFLDPSGGGFRRDVYTALGYPPNITPEQYWGRYRRGGVAERIVEAYPNATWGGGGSIVEDPDPRNQTAFEIAAETLFQRLDIWSRFRQADILAGLGHYSVILIGADGDLSEPLEDTLSDQESILYLTPRDELKAKIDALDKDTTSERFGLPETYQLDLGSTTNPKVHWSRIIHVVEGNLENEVFGKPRLRAIWNYLEDLDKNVGGGSEAAWKRMDSGMHLDIPFVGPDGQALEIPPEVEQDIEDEVEEFQHGMRRFIRTRGVNLTQMQANVTAFASNADMVLKLVSATSGIPFRILTGSERGSLASTQDKNNWNDRVAERREGFAEPLVTGFVDEMINRGALPAPGPDGYRVVWPEADELDEAEKAAVSKSLATANREQSAAGDGIIVTRDEIRDTIFGLEPLDAGGTEFAPGELDAQGEQTIEESLITGAADNVNEDAEEPEWKGVHRAADSNTGPFTMGVLDFWSLVGAAIPAQEFTDALNLRDETEASNLVIGAFAETAEGFAGSLFTAIYDTLIDGGNNAAAIANRRGGWTAAQFNVAFNAEAPQAIAWAETRAATLVAETSPETIEGIREIIVTGFSEGTTAQNIARTVRTNIGLLERQVTAVENLTAELKAAEPGSLVTRFPPSPGIRKQPGFKVRIPAEGLAQKDLERRVAQYSSMQLNLRATTIARSETMRAANEGQRQLWLQAQADGQLPQDAKRIWITTPDERLRVDHAAMDGVVVGIEESFDVPDGTTEPGEAIQCRCAAGIASEKEIKAAG